MQHTRLSPATIACFLSLTATVSGCAISSDTGQACLTTTCIAENIQRDLRDRCIRDLNRPSRAPKGREALYDEYRYPLTDASNYASWIRMGGQVPAPHEWCRAYAVAKQRSVANAYRAAPARD
jgi:hypothetical protein